MSRKTRKLMWSVPLIAAVAAIGVLAAYVMLTPDGAQAHEPGANTVPHLPPDPVTEIDVITPTIDNGGRTSLQVSWNAPEGGDPVATYRVDISKDTDLWMNVIGGEASDEALTEAEAMSNCGDDDEGNRCYTATDLDSNTLYHFRVFAMNEFGTSPISVDETLGSGMTLRIDPPAKATGLDATDYYEDKIVVSWHGVVETGGADVLWYCLGVASSPGGAFTDLTAQASETACLTAEEPTAAAMADDDGVYTSPVDISTLITDTTDVPQTIVVAATDEDGDAVNSYEHLGLHTPDIIELRYRLSAVTDEDGDPETTDDRRIARATSEVAPGKTVRPADKPDPRFESPPAVDNLRAVAYTTADLTADPVPAPGTGNQGLHFFWTHPDGYNPDYDDDDALDDPNWYVQVQRRVPADEDHDDYAGWQFVTGDTNPTTALATGYGRAQFSVDFTATLDTANDPPESWAAPVLWGDAPSHRTYRVRYVNPGADDVPGTDAHDNTNMDDDVPGGWREITIPQVTANYFRNAAVPDNTSTLPIIALSATDNAAPGLRFEYNDDNPRDHIDLLWTRNTNARSGQNEPNGYVIDRSPDGGATWEGLRRADTPTELGTGITFTDSPSGDHEVDPGHQYQYRVFPVFIESGPNAFGIPGLVNANSQGADLPGAAQSVRAEADGQTACVVKWAPPADDGGHDVRGYLIQMAPDDDGNPGTFVTIALHEDIAPTPPLTVVGKNTVEFKYTGSATQLATPATLSAGSVRWYRVIPITDENDGVDTTGGAVLNEQGGTNAPRNSRGTTVPLQDDIDRADPAKCTTDGLGDAPADKDIADPHMPVDLTVEAASDTNSLADSDRGVFLTWNQQPKGDASATSSYIINRIRMNTGVPALNDEADDWQYLTRVSNITSYTDSTDLRRDEETRMYQVCSEATGVTDPVCVDMPANYALHAAHAPDAPYVTATAGYASASDWWETLDCAAMVAAVGPDATGNTGMANMANPYCAHYPGSAAEMGGGPELAAAQKMVVDDTFTMRYPNMGVTSVITLTWDAPSDGGSPITGYTVQSKYGTMDFMDAEVKPLAMDDTTVVHTGLMANTTYTYQVRAMNVIDSGAWSMASMAMTGNTDPVREGSIDAITVMPGQMSDAMDVSMYFSDADGDTLTYEPESSDDMIATASVSGSMVTVTGVAAGMATITVTASDGNGGTAMQTFDVTVESGVLTAASDIEASHDGVVVTIKWAGGENADTFTVALLSRNADGSWDIDNAVYDTDADSPHTVNMATRPAGTYLVFVAAGTDDGEWSAWASGTLDYQPQDGPPQIGG